MRHYALFALRTIGIILAVITTAMVIFTGVIWVGNMRHNDEGTAAKASGAAAGIVNWHDTLIKRLNTAIDGNDQGYEQSLAFGINNYSFFDQNGACQIGQGTVYAAGILESKTYKGTELRNVVMRTLDRYGYKYTVKVKADNYQTQYLFDVTDGTYVTNMSVKYSKTYSSGLDAWLGVSSSRTDKQDPCYSLNTLPKSQAQFSRF